jgi:hypothetical protein
MAAKGRRRSGSSVTRVLWIEPFEVTVALGRFTRKLLP